MHRGVVILLWVVGILAVAIAASRVLGSVGVRRVVELKIGNANLASVPDGTYRGSYAGGRFSNTVEVDVADHRIAGIRIIKDITFRMASVRQQLFDKVIAGQSLSVDAVSGATATTHAYLKAIENALRSAEAR
jgi:uncharacterized protein with FMN-binding domain